MARDQVAVVEMITDMILGKTEGVSRVDFTPQKIKFPEELPYEQAFERATPESQGISSKWLEMLIRELNDSEYTDMHQLMILKGGKVICECSFAPYRSRMWHITHSMCKSITGMAVGMLIEEGQLSLDENIYKIFEQRMNPLAKIFRPEVTVEHLLTMTSGVSFNESGIISGNDWLESYLNAPVIGTLGTKFQYNSLNSYVLSAIISERTGMTMEEYLRPRLFEPMGITRYLWETCPKGITKGGWGLFLCAEDMAKLGQLYLNKGRWNGQQLVSEEWVETSTQKHVESGDDTFGYGYQIWMEERQGSFEFNGMLGQNVVVYPDMDMVIVTNAGNNELFQNCVMLNIIRKYFSKDYQPEERLPENPREYEKLRRLTEQVQYGISRHDRIRRGGWKKKCGVTRSHALHSETYYQNNQLDGKCYEMKPQSVGLYPLVIQVFHNNMTEGVRKIAFRKEGEDLFICFLEGEQWCELKIGFQKAQDNWLTLHEESYLVAVSGVFSTDADGNLVLKLEMAYLEEAVRRRIYFYFRGNEMEARWYETPGKALIMEGLESITEDLTRHPIYNKLKEWGGMDLAHRLMEQTIEPVIRGYLEESVQDDSDES